MRKSLCVYCTLLLGASLVLAQADNVATPGADVRGSVVPQNVADDVFAGDAIYGYTVGGTDANEPFCPPDALAVQNPVAAGGTWFYSDLEFCNPSNSSQCKRARCEVFPNLSKPFGKIRFEGTTLDGTASGCEKPDRFRIRLFAPGNNPDPNNWIYEEQDPLVVKTFTREVNFQGGLGPAKAYYYTIVLATPQNLPNGGFVSIQGKGDPKCWFLWAGSQEGDGCVWSWWETDIPNSFNKQCIQFDLNYCIQERKSGACCDDRTATCQDGVDEIACGALGRYFKANTLCSQLNPQCGSGIGACCGDAGPNDCTLTTYQDCEGTDSTGKRWIGRDKLCSECCTIVIGTNNENEPDTSQCGCCPGDANCDGVRNFADINPFVEALSGKPPCSKCNVDVNGDGEINFADINPFVEKIGQDCDQNPDNFNRGCNGDPNGQGYPKFLPIEPNKPVWGELGTYKVGANSFRDEDWYRYTTGSPSKLFFEVEAEVPVEALIAYSGKSCGGPNDPVLCYQLYDFLNNEDCPAKVTVSTPCLPAGTFYFIVRPVSFEGVKCGMDYKATMTVQGNCTACNVTCSGYTEQEACREDKNGGCNSTPRAFELLPSDTLTFCGKTWACNGARDTDWYAVNINRTARQKWTVESEVPIRATPVFDYSTQTVRPPDPNCTQYWTWTATYTKPDPGTGCDTLTSPDLSQYLYAPGQYWFLVLPDRDGAGNRVFYGYPCGALNEYKVNLTTEGVNCDDVCNQANITDEEITQNKICGPEYVDTLNGGCDSDTPDLTKVQAVTLDDRICGQTGNYVRNNQKRRDFDWYRLNNPALQKISFGLKAEIPFAVELYKGTTCANLQQLDSFQDNILCNNIFETHITACLPAGNDYYLRVFPRQTDPDVWPCRDPNSLSDFRYAIDIVAEDTCFQTCEVTCTGGQDEACGEKPDKNPGCNKNNGADPNDFMVFAKGVEYCGRIYDVALFDPNGTDRDVDWFKFTVTSAQFINWTAKADFRLDLETFATCGGQRLDYITFDKRDDNTWAIPQGTSCQSVTKQTVASYNPGTYIGVLSNLYIGGMPCSSNKVEYTIRWD